MSDSAWLNNMVIQKLYYSYNSVISTQRFVNLIRDQNEAVTITTTASTGWNWRCACTMWLFRRTTPLPDRRCPEWPPEDSFCSFSHLSRWGPRGGCPAGCSASFCWWVWGWDPTGGLKGCCSFCPWWWYVASCQQKGGKIMIIAFPE